MKEMRILLPARSHLSGICSAIVLKNRFSHRLDSVCQLLFKADNVQ